MASPEPVGPSQDTAEQQASIDAELRYRLAQSDFELVTLRAKHEEALQQIALLQAVPQRLAEVEAAEQRVVQEAQQRVAALAEERDRWRAQVAALESERDGWRSQLEEVTAERDRWQSQIQGLEAERDRSRAQESRLRQVATGVSETLARVSSELGDALNQSDTQERLPLSEQAAQEHRLRRFLGR